MRISDWSSDVCSSDLGLSAHLITESSSMMNDVQQLTKYRTELQRKVDYLQHSLRWAAAHDGMLDDYVVAVIQEDDIAARINSLLHKPCASFESSSLSPTALDR